MTEVLSHFYLKHISLQRAEAIVEYLNRETRTDSMIRIVSSNYDKTEHYIETNRKSLIQRARDLSYGIHIAGMVQ